MTAPLFSIRDADVVRAGRTTLHVGEFDLAEGEHVALLGPNGAGKSTFIQLLTREVLPVYREEPPVRFRGQARPRLEDIHRALGIVSSTMHDQVRVHLPADQVVVGGIFGTLGLPMRREVTDAHRAAALDAMGRLGIADLVGRDIMTLSTGQARRVLVARELVRDPRVLVFDEPCTGLDPQGIIEMRELILKLNREHGMTVVMVSSELQELRSICDRIAIVSEGRLVDILSPDASDADFGLAMSGIKPDEHRTKGGRAQ